ncbi:uncharacterized protein [Linepithema humile]|uniref:uncharacterized protein isoform X1 n=1 Tax=Linepithema humile TaxID=83485 RepID=UPI00351ECD34
MGDMTIMQEARKKLKKAEELSELESCPEQEEFLKKSRKLRTAKIIDSSSSNDKNEETEMAISVDLPKVPNILNPPFKSCNTDLLKTKSSQAQKDFKYVRSKEKRTTTDTQIGPIAYQQKKDMQNTKDFFNELLQNNNIYETVVPGNCENLQSTENIIAELLIDANNESVTVPITETPIKENTNRTLMLEQDAPRALEHDPEMRQKGDPSQIFNENYNFIQDSKEFQRFVIRKLLKIEIKTNCIERCIKLIANTPNNMAQPEQNVMDVFEDLPLKTKNDLDIMEDRLGRNAIYRSEMVKQLTRLTCKDLRSSCLSVIKQTLSNEVANHYSWYGAKKKENFSKLHLCKVIMSVIRKSYPNATDAEISAPLKVWFAHAKERLTRETENND